MWAALRFGLLSWLSDDAHQARLVVEGLSWVAGVLALPVGLVTLVLQVRSQRHSAVDQTESAAALPSQAVGAGGVIVNGGVHGHGPGMTIGVVTGGQVSPGQPPDPR